MEPKAIDVPERRCLSSWTKPDGRGILLLHRHSLRSRDWPCCRMGRYRHDVPRHSDRLCSNYAGHSIKNLITCFRDATFSSGIADSRMRVKCVDELFTYVRWTGLGAPGCEMRNSRRPDRFSIICYSDCPLSSPCSMIWI